MCIRDSDRVYSPDRLLYPMRRRAGVPKSSLPHGRESEAFERISWDEALDTIATRLAAIASEHGPESILPYSYAGTIGILNYGSMDRRFFHRLGASQLDRTICSETGGQALISVYGRKLGTDTVSYTHLDVYKRQTLRHRGLGDVELHLETATVHLHGHVAQLGACTCLLYTSVAQPRRSTRFGSLWFAPLIFRCASAQQRRRTEGG